MTNNIQPLLALLTAHYAVDFLFQTKRGIATKKWNSFSMISHIGVVFFLTFLFWQHFIGSLLIALAHWSIDILKIYFLKDKKRNIYHIFLVDQIAHLISILVVWLIFSNSIQYWIELFIFHCKNTEIWTILLAYLFVSYPVGYALKLFFGQYLKNDHHEPVEVDKSLGNNANWGMLIGIFERMIILTFILLKEYEAIGFLITGKSIIRFKAKEDVRSEYVLLGTLISFSIAIGIGLLCI